jgi:hypothetical protein
MKRSEARHHHYVPQFYLKGFARPGGGKFPQVSVIDLERKTEYDTSIRNVGAERDFNRVEGEGIQPDAVETAYSKLEVDFGKAIDRIDKSLAFDGEDRAWVLNLIALLAVRNPAMRANWADFQSQIMKITMGMTLETKERFDSITTKMRAAGQDVNESVTYEEVKEFFDRGEYDIEIANEHHIRMEMVGAGAILPTLVDRRWLMLVADEQSGPFITSNHPVTLIYKKPDTVPAMYRMSPGHGLPGTQLVFPLNMRLALIGEFEGDNGVVKATREIVAALKGVRTDDGVSLAAL